MKKHLSMLRSSMSWSAQAWSARRYSHSNSGPKRLARKNWTFEKLEDRHFLSATPLGDIQFGSLSNETAEGAQALLLRELEAAFAQSLNANGVEAVALAFPNDPLLLDQWFLLNTGQSTGSPLFQPTLGVPGEDINVVPAWELGYTGKGVIIGIVDSGIDLTHPDLINNLSQFRLNAATGSTAPGAGAFLQNDPDAPHGTAVAGLAAGDGNNGTGITGVAYDAQIAAIQFLGDQSGDQDANTARALSFQNQEIDIYNNSWGPGDDPANPRQVSGPGPQTLQALQQSITFGRGGLGNIFVFASGNSAGPQFAPGFQGIGSWDSASYDGFVNSRYTIGIGGVDQDGGYNNADGTITAYLEAGPSILAVAPTGSINLEIGLENGIGSGIWTTDIQGDDGYNRAPVNGIEIDNDFLADTDYTSRFNGSSASAPIASGVIALMLEANPNLTWRDVQEIIVRSARQNAALEIPGTGAGTTGNAAFVGANSWITNASQTYRDPDPFETGPSAFFDVYDPLWKATNDVFFSTPGIPTPNSGFNTRQANAPPSPFLFANGAGYTVSQGRGAFGEEFGYGNGVLDAELAVQLASQWTTLSQSRSPIERRWTTFVLQDEGLFAEPATVSNDDSGNLLIPGGLDQTPFGSPVPFINEYFVDDPFSGEEPPINTRGGFIQINPPDSQLMSVETIEVRVSFEGDNDLDWLKLNLTSPSGTHSQLNNFFDLGGVGDSVRLQQDSWPGVIFDPPGTINGSGGQFVWTFTTNRNWGERSDSALIIDPATGEPFLDSFDATPVERAWELQIENFSSNAIGTPGIEVIFNGNPLQQGSKRIQGNIGIDQNGDGDFNFDRFLQTTFDNDGDGITNRQSEIQRIGDINQEAFADNVVVELVRDSDGVVVDQFITGDDGNFYFDALPGDYTVRLAGTNGTDAFTEAAVVAGTLPRFQQEWQITTDWFRAAEKQVELFQAEDGLGVVQNFQRFRTIDAGGGSPMAFTYIDPLTTLPTEVENNVSGINFLINPGAPVAQEITVTGNINADFNGNGIVDGFDVGVGGISVFADLNSNGFFDTSSEPIAQSSADGSYSLVVPATSPLQFNAIVQAPSGWTTTAPVSGVISVFGSPGATVAGNDFSLSPPVGTGGSGVGDEGRILGAVFEDSNGNGLQDIGETGIAGRQVFADLNQNGIFDGTDISTTTGASGAYSLFGVPVGVTQVRVATTADDQITTPILGFQQISMTSNGTFSNLLFGVRNLATRDFGDLLGFPTTEADNGPWSIVVQGVSLGLTVDGEIDGNPTAGADGDDNDRAVDDEDGIRLVTAAGVPVEIIQAGMNFVEVDVRGIGGNLNAWMDFNDNNAFDDGEQIFTDVDLLPGTHLLSYTAPSVPAAGATVASRFRWGQAGLSYTGGSLFAGEVEDYEFPTVPGGGGLGGQGGVEIPGDYDGSGLVDQADYNLWKSTFGSNSDLRADGNGNGAVDISDYTVWQDNLGATSGSGNAVALSRSGVSVGGEIARLPTGLSTGFSTYATATGFGNFGFPEEPTSIESAAREAGLPDGYISAMERLGYTAQTIRIGLNRTQIVFFAPTVLQAANATSTPADDSPATEIASVADEQLERGFVLASAGLKRFGGSSILVSAGSSLGSSNDSLRDSSDLLVLDRAFADTDDSSNDSRNDLGDSLASLRGSKAKLNRTAWNAAFDEGVNGGLGGVNWRVLKAV